MTSSKWHFGQVGQGAKNPFGGFFLIEIPNKKEPWFLVEKTNWIIYPIEWKKYFVLQFLCLQACLRAHDVSGLLLPSSWAKKMQVTKLKWKKKRKCTPT